MIQDIREEKRRKLQRRNPTSQIKSRKNNDMTIDSRYMGKYIYICVCVVFCCCSLCCNCSEIREKYVLYDMETNSNKQTSKQASKQTKLNKYLIPAITKNKQNKQIAAATKQQHTENKTKQKYKTKSLVLTGAEDDEDDM
jgi:hypothetical protein